MPLKGLNGFWLNATHLVEKERIYNFFHVGPLLTEMCSVSFVFRNSAYSYSQRAIFFKDNQKRKLFIQGILGI
jgi:hypothetical protein